MNSIQFFQTNPEEFLNSISGIIKEEIDNLKKNFQPKEPPKYLTRKEAADFLKIDLSTLYLWTKKGKLTSYCLGNRVYYKISDIENSLIKMPK